jgi:hypothetical protein
MKHLSAAAADDDVAADHPDVRSEQLGWTPNLGLIPICFSGIAVADGRQKTMRFRLSSADVYTQHVAVAIDVTFPSLRRQPRQRYSEPLRSTRAE